ncbi:MAG: class I SAM-dependent methyltransferase [Pseudomonadales bacterium]
MPELTFDDIDAGRSFDWGRTSADYDRFRPGPPDSFYRKLQALDIGLPGQRILDLGTGTGLLARRFAAQGARAWGIDVAEAQIAMARAAAAREQVDVDFRVAPSESLPFADGAFDVITANQCWLYFDPARTIPEVCRTLAPGGRLVVSHFSFMPRLDPLVRASEQLVLQHNPDWSGADWDGVLPPVPAWSREAFELVGLFVYDEQIPFTRAGWRGRMRALRGIAASLTEDEVRAFDREHEALLERLVPERFDVCHRIHAHVFSPR